MRPLPFVLLCATLGLGCGEKEPTDDSEATDDSAVEGDADADSDADTDTDTDTDADTDADTDTDLPSVWEGLDPDHCEDSPGKEHLAGATSYYIGEYRELPDQGWVGTEYWVLYATSEWESAGGSDCMVVWDMDGSTTEVGACAACELAVTVNASLNRSQTTCPEDLYEDEETYSVTYDLDQKPDGTVDVYFSSSGNYLGAGFHTTDRFNFVTSHSCKWF